MRCKTIKVNMSLPVAAEDEKSIGTTELKIFSACSIDSSSPFGEKKIL